jgi:hypothetical protein
MTRLKFGTVITALLFGIACALPASAQRSLDPAQKRAQTFLVCKREADTKVPLADAAPSDQITMNHYLAFADCMQRYGYAVDDNAAANQ